MVALIKFCGFTRERDLDFALSLGIDAVGLNLVSSSPRVLDETLARALAARVTCKLVWVVDAQPPQFLARLLRPEHIIQRVQPGATHKHAWDVVRLASEADVQSAAALPSDLLVCDRPGSLGGSGLVSNWALAAALSKRRPIVLAGGLTPDNVADAIAAVQPFGVDVSSGIESAPGKKDDERMQSFVERARR